MNSENDFAEDFYNSLHEFRSEPSTDKPAEDKPSHLSSILDGQSFTKQCLDAESFGVHGFLTRFDAEEVEWFLNKPIHKNQGNTCVHEAVLSQSVDKLTLILKHGGNCLYSYS